MSRGSVATSFCSSLIALSSFPSLAYFSACSSNFSLDTSHLVALFPCQLDRPPKPEQVTFLTESENHPLGDRRDERFLAKILPRLDIGEVDLHDRQVDGGDRIPDRHARMGEGGRIDHHRIEPPSRPLQPFHDLPFVVRLEYFQRDLLPFRQSLQGAVNLGERDAAVDRPLPPSEQIEIRTVKYQDPQSSSLRRRAR